MNASSAVPVYKLYGEQEAWPTADMVHWESIAARSSLHNWHINPHRHAGLFQLLLLEQGSALVQVDDGQQRMCGGQVLAVPPSCIHGFHFERDAVGSVTTIALTLAQKLLASIEGGLLHLTQLRMHTFGDDAESAHMRALFDAFAHEYRERRPYRNALMETLLEALLIALSRHLSPGIDLQAGHGAGHHYARFCDLVEQWYARHHPVPRYAAELGITAAHLNLLCRQAAGRPALAIIHERLLLEVKRNLVYTSMSIAEISYAAGFADPAYFTRFFKQRAGVGPKEYRRTAEQRLVHG